MRYALYSLLFCLIAVVLALAGALYLAVEDQPIVKRATAFTPSQIERAKRIVAQNDPRKAKAGMLRTISLSQEELDLALNYLADRYGKASSRIALQPGMAAISASIELPRNPLGRVVNVTALLRETAALPSFDQLRVGQLPVPTWLADALLEHGLRRLSTREDFRKMWRYPRSRSGRWSLGRHIPMRYGRRMPLNSWGLAAISAHLELS